MNNKASFIVSIVSLLIAIIAIIFAFTKSKNTKENITVSTNNSELKIAFVNVDTLLNYYDLYNNLMIDYYNKQNDYERELQSKLTALQRQAMTLQDQYNKGLITSITFQQKMQKLQQEQQTVQQWYQEKSQELAQDQQLIMSRVTDSILTTIKSFNKNSQYHLILNKAALLYGTPDMDITDTLINLMNNRVNR